MHWFLSILILLLSFYRLYLYVKKVRKYYKAAATIIGNDIETSNDPLMGTKYYYSPIVEFTNNKGEKMQMIFSENNPDRPLYTEGSKITVLVDPSDSTRFLMYDFVSGYLIPFIWILIGISIVAIPYIFPESFR